MSILSTVQALFRAEIALTSLAFLLGAKTGLTGWIAVKALPAVIGNIPSSEDYQLPGWSTELPGLAILGVAVLGLLSSFALAVKEHSPLSFIFIVVVGGYVITAWTLLLAEYLRAFEFAIYRTSSAYTAWRPAPASLNILRLLVAFIGATTQTLLTIINPSSLVARLTACVLIYRNLTVAKSSVSMKQHLYMCVFSAVMAVSVCGTLSFFKFDDSNSKDLTSERASALTFLWCRSLLTGLSGTFVVICYRIDYLFAGSPPTTPRPISVGTNGIVIPSFFSIPTFPKPVFSLAMSCWIISGIFSAAFIHFKLYPPTLKTDYLFELLEVGVSLPLMTIVVTGFAKWKGVLGQVWNYEEDWRTMRESAGRD